MDVYIGNISCFINNIVGYLLLHLLLNKICYLFFGRIISIDRYYQHPD